MSKERGTGPYRPRKIAFRLHQTKLNKSYPPSDAVVEHRRGIVAAQLEARLRREEDQNV